LASSLVLSKGLEGGFEDGIRDGWSLVLRMASVAASWMALTMSLLIIDKQTRQQMITRAFLFRNEGSAGITKGLFVYSLGEGFEDGIRDGWSLVLRMASEVASWMVLSITRASSSTKVLRAASVLASQNGCWCDIMYGSTDGGLLWLELVCWVAW
jgi:hypothetical protein